MTNFDLQFSKLICFSQLNLTSGDSLSINTEESTYDFALNLAKFATTITNVTVNIVVTIEGKVSQTVPVDPDLLDIQRPSVTSQVMCRIFDLNNFLYENNANLDEIYNNVVEISKFALLSEPIDLKRRIALPWTVVAYPSKAFVKNAFASLNDNEILAYFAKLLRLDNSNTTQYWINQAGLLDYRTKTLNSLNAKEIVIKNKDSKFKARFVENSNWASNYITLKNNRSFFNFLPTQNVHINLENDSSEGHIQASKDFYLFGELIKNAKFNIKDGRVISYSADLGQNALEAFFKCDENANVVSSIFISEEETIESKYIVKAAHPLYALENSCSIILGGAVQDSLLNIDEETALDDIKINQSLVKLAIPIGDIYTHINLDNTKIMEDGIFII